MKKKTEYQIFNYSECRTFHRVENAVSYCEGIPIDQASWSIYRNIYRGDRLMGSAKLAMMDDFSRVIFPRRACGQKWRLSAKNRNRLMAQSIKAGYMTQADIDWALY